MRRQLFIAAGGGVGHDACAARGWAARGGVRDCGTEAVRSDWSPAGLYGADRGATGGRGRGRWLGWERRPAAFGFADRFGGRVASGLSRNEAGGGAVRRGGPERHSGGCGDVRRRRHGWDPPPGVPGCGIGDKRVPCSGPWAGSGGGANDVRTCSELAASCPGGGTSDRFAADRRGGWRRRGRHGSQRKWGRLRQPWRGRGRRTEPAASFGQPGGPAAITTATGTVVPGFAGGNVAAVTTIDGSTSATMGRTTPGAGGMRARCTVNTTSYSGSVAGASGSGPNGGAGGNASALNPCCGGPGPLCSRRRRSWWWRLLRRRRRRHGHGEMQPVHRAGAAAPARAARPARASSPRRSSTRRSCRPTTRVMCSSSSCP